MPTIDKLAAESLVLTNFHSVAPLCTPSRYTMLTGKFASRATNSSFLERMAKEGVPSVEYNVGITNVEPTLPKRLQALGVRTGFYGKEHVTDKPGSPVPNNSSIYSSGIPALIEQDQTKIVNIVKGIGFDEAGNISRGNPVESPVTELRVHNLDWIADGAIRFIDRNFDKRFFLVVSLSIPHVPTDPQFSWNADPKLTAGGILAQAPSVMPARSTLSSRVAAAGFPGQENLLWADDAVAAVMDALARHDIKNKTAVFLMGDHGMSPKATIYIGSTKTPAFVNYRGVRGISDEMTATVDIMPTLVAMFGGQGTEDGVSMMPLLTGQPGPLRSSLYIELGYARSVIDDRYQYIAIRHSDFMTQIANTYGYPLTPLLVATGPSTLETNALKNYPHALDRDQLYDWRRDPQQHDNLFYNQAYRTIADHKQSELQAQKDNLPGIFLVK